MSNQPSTTESLKIAASNAAETITSTLSKPDPNYDASKDKTNFARDDHGNVYRKGDFKDQLNRAANGAEEDEGQKGVVEKVYSYIPNLSTIQNSLFQKNPPPVTDSNGKAENDKAPPQRPEHDVQVEQFLRKQYHSQSGDGMPNPDKK